jgi:protein phosphatase
MTGIECFALADLAEEDTMEDSHSVEPALGLFVVADGMGGREGGSVASRTAVTSLVERVSRLEPDDRFAPTALRDAVCGVNQDVLQRARENPALAGLGTTLAAVVLAGEQARTLHVGDSRIYLFREGRIRRLTRDHTITAELVEMERLSPELADKHPLRGLLSRFVGSANDWQPDIEELRVSPGDWIALLTDGVTAVLSDEELQSLLADEHSRGAESICRRVITEAITREPPDNVTAVAVGIL